MNTLKQKSTKRLLGLLLVVALLVTMWQVPFGTVAAVPTYADLTGNGQTYDFESGCGTYVGSNETIGGGTIAISADTLTEQKEVRVAGWSWSVKTLSGEASTLLRSNKPDNASYPTGGALRLNNKNGFAVVKPGKSYHVSLRYKVRSGIKYYSNGTLPADTAASYLYFGYNLRVSNYTSSGNGMANMENPVVKLAYNVKGGNTFSYSDEDGNVSDREVGVWYTENFYFSVPSNFNGESNHIGFLANCYTGTDFVIDDVNVREVNAVMLNMNDGTGVIASHPADPGQPVDLPTPVRDGYTFGGWYTNAACTSAFSNSTYTAAHNGISLYAKWNHSLNCHIADFTDYAAGGVSLTGSNSKNASFTDTAVGVKANLTFDLTGSKTGYAPLADRDGAIRVDSGSTYAVTVVYNTTASFANANSTISLRTGSADGTTVGTVDLPKSDKTNTVYQTINTGSASGKVFVNIDSAQGDLQGLTFISIKLTKITSNTNYIYAYDPMTGGKFELYGSTGETIGFPTLDAGEYYVFDGWFNDEALTDRNSGKFTSGVSYVYAGWNNAVIDFENYQFVSDTSRHTVGEDCSVQKIDNAYSGAKALRYQYNYQPNYFDGTANALALAVVYNNSTYKVTFKYRLDQALADVQLKFFTANRFTRWAFFRNYDQATYTVFTSDIGAGWKEATVYFTTNIVETSADALYMSFNPTVEGATTMYVDDITITKLDSSRGVVAYLGKGNTVYTYVEGTAGTTAAKPTVTPKARFSSFDGWYNNADYSGSFSAPSVSAGQIKYVYSKWTDLAEDFDSYPYMDDGADVITSSLSLTKVSNSYVMNNNTNATAGVFPLGEVQDNTTYKVTLRYRGTQADAYFGFMTADGRNKAVNRHVYGDEGNTVAGNSDSFVEKTLFFTTAFAKTGETVGNVLYGRIGPHTMVENIRLTKVDVLSGEGVSVLTDAAATVAGKQAMRFYFGYQAQNAAFLTIDGADYTLCERGVVFSDATDTAAVVPHDVSEGSAAGVKVFGIKTGFGNYWRYDANRELTVYSVYLDGFKQNDTRLTGTRGYLVFADGQGNRYTVYAPAKTDDVAEVKALVAEITDKTVHTIADKNWNRFTIVHPKCMSYIYGMVIEDLQAYAADKGVVLEDVTEKAAEKIYEIVVGETTREATGLVQRPEGDNYVIAVVGTKVIIRGGNDLALMQALQDFLGMLKLKDSLGCGLDIRDGYVKYGTYVPTSSNYTATLLEDFNGATLDPMWGSYGGYGQGWPYTPSVLEGTVGVRKYGDTAVTTKSGRTVSLVRLESGNLVLGTAYITPTYPADITNNAQIITSKVSTFYSMLYQYGVLEFKVKLGDGPCCTSLWMNGDGSVTGHQEEKKDSATEFDLIESYGRKNYFAAMVHEWWDPAFAGASNHTGFEPTGSEYWYTPDEDEEDLYSSYHTFTFIWTPDGVKFAFDGKTWAVLDFNDFYYSREANHIIMSAGMGSPTYGTKYDPGRHKDYYETNVDYVYLYQVADMGSRYCTKE